ncbi:MAG: hypothetical protein KAT68_03230 [Bacteroidales bacterium]|nr:hypothetical protein [Bacteroidales bacterium]
MEYFSFIDVFLIPVSLIIIYFIAANIKLRKIDNSPEYRYYVWGLFAKIFGAIGLCIIYTKYYEGGDTTAYFKSSVALGNLLFKSPGTFFSILSGNLSPENYSHFNFSTGWPAYYNDPTAFSVVRFVSIFTIIGFKRFYLTSIIIAIITYSGIWRLFLFFCEIKPKIRTYFAISVLFIPSVIFWGSGILKDSFTLAAAGWLVYCFNNIYTKRKKIPLNILYLIFSIYIILSFKPYLFFSLSIGIFVWITISSLNKIKSTFLKTIFFPFLIFIIWSLGSIIIGRVGFLIGGDYSSVQNLIEKAYITQDDLKKDYYHGNSFDIGTFEPTIPSISSKIPAATIAGLFRPFIWEARNPVMILSGIENLLFLLLTLFLFFRSNPIYFIKSLFKNPVITFSFVFSISFAFAVGLSTSNFGSLVRYKIPLIPFYLSSLFYIYTEYRERNKTLI